MESNDIGAIIFVIGMLIIILPFIIEIWLDCIIGIINRLRDFKK